MKKQILITCSTALAVFIANGVNAQSWTYPSPDIVSSPDTRNVIIDNTSKLGINTMNPVDALSVNGEIGFDPGYFWYRTIRGRSNTGMVIWGNTGWHDGAGILLDGNGTSSPGSLSLVTTSAGSGGDGAFSFWKADNGGNWTDNLMTIFKNGNVGIGTYATDKLNVDGDIGLTATTNTRTFKASSPSGGIRLLSGTDYTDGAYILMRGASHSGSGFGDKGRLTFCATGDNSDQLSMGMEFLLYNTSSNQWTNYMTLRKDGKLLIGSQIISDFYNSLPPDWDEIPDGYKLFVEEGIITEKVKVALRNTNEWADHVFANDYQLQPLSEVADFIQSNKHLPNVPSAEELVRSGIDLGKMDAKLLQKIEELTLYVIEQNKKIDVQQKEIEALKTKMNK